MNRARSFLLVAVLLLSTGHVRAASIAVLRPPSSAPAVAEAVHRLQGELFALGLAVRFVERRTTRGTSAENHSDDDQHDDFSRIAAELGLDALIVVIGDANPSAVDVWIFEPSPRGARVSRAVLEPDAPNAAETLAIRAIEILRSNFIEIELAARAHSEAPAALVARDEPQKPPSRRVQRFGIEAGIALLGSLDGVGPALLPLVRLDFAPNSWLTAQATLAGLGTRPTIETALGNATVSQSYGLVGLGYLPPFELAVRPFVSLAAGALSTSIEGDADSPEQGHFVSQWSFLLDAAIGARFEVSERYYLTPAFHVEIAQPYVVVHFVDEEVASFGNPNLLVSVTFGGWL